MATYNFTVRATDNTGAYADRNFSMTVNNTQIDRFVIATSLGLARSVDGLTWNTEPGLPCDHVRWENNQWIAWNSSYLGGTNYIRTSVDGLNWKYLTPVLKTYRTSYSSPTWSMPNQIKYRKGAYYAYFNLYASSIYNSDEYTSTDLVNWYASSGTTGVYTFTSGSTYDGIQDFEYDASTDAWVVFASGLGTTAYVGRRTGSGTFTGVTSNLASINTVIPLNSGQNTASNQYTRYIGKVFFQNGLWVISTGNTGVWTSVDTVNWTYRDMSVAGSGTSIWGPIFSNGRLICLPMGTNTSVVIPTPVSTNAGHTFAKQSGGYTYPTAFATLSPVLQPMDTYAGTTVMVQPARNGLAATTKDDGVTWTSTSLNLGTAYAVAARNT